MLVTDWTKYEPFFTEKEFKCRHCGECEVESYFMDALLALRKEYGKPMVVTSGYRCPNHPKEVIKKAPGQHNRGRAVDIGCGATEAYRIIELALDFGFTGVGISQHPDRSRFIHLDMRDTIPVIYSY